MAQPNASRGRKMMEVVAIEDDDFGFVDPLCLRIILLFYAITFRLTFFLEKEVELPWTWKPITDSPSLKSLAVNDFKSSGNLHSSLRLNGSRIFSNAIQIHQISSMLTLLCDDANG
eukprot:scaffold26750_cov153-Skeletonema_menzelii.AAC.5